MENEEIKLDLILKLFKEIKSLYARNIEFVEYGAYDFFPCWIIGTYIFESFDSFPYVYLHAPKRSGKSKTLLLTSKLAKDSINAVNVSQASVYRVLEERRPTLFIDEADYLSSEEKAELYKILNAGYKKGASVLRCESNGKKFEIKEWNVYCPKMLASVDELKEQFIDRCITFPLLRSRNKEIANSVIKESVDDKGVKWEVWRSGTEEYANKIKSFILKNLEEIDADKKMEEIIGRDRELWLPILAIGKTLEPEVYATLINLALEKVARTREQEKETIEHAIINEVFAMTNENVIKPNSWVYVKDISERMKLKPEWDWSNIRSIGKVMKRLDFLLRHTNQGSMYFIDKTRLEDLARRYGVDLEIKVEDKQEILEK
jgi:hypothetical protein